MWRAALQAAEAIAPEASRILFRPEGLIFTGEGPGYSLARAAAPLYQLALGRPAMAVPAAHICQAPGGYLPRIGRWTLIAIARATESAAVLQAVQVFRAWSSLGAVVALTNDAESPLLGHSDVGVLVQDFPAAELNAAGLLATQMIGACGADDILYRAELRGLPGHGEELIARAEAVRAQLSGVRASRIVCLGSGPLHGVAEEGARILRTALRLPTEAYATAEFLHGPVETVGPETAVILLRSIAGEQGEQQAAAAVAGTGATVLAIGSPGIAGAQSLPCGESLSDRARPVLYHLAFQLLAACLESVHPKVDGPLHHARSER